MASTILPPRRWQPPHERDRLEPIGFGARIAATIVSLGCLGLLVVAWTMRPASEGLGTHTQLGLPACSWPETVGAPCPTCGMTTAFACASDGQLLGSVRAQPFGALLALGAAGGFWVGAYAGVTGSRVFDPGAVLSRPRVLWTLAALAGLAWVYKIIVYAGSTG